MSAPDFKLTAKQKEAIKLLASQAMFILLYGGSRSTKTFTLIRCIVIRALMAPKSRHAILRFRFAHVKASVIYDTFPKVMELCFPQVKYKLNKQDWFAKLENGSEIWFGGLDDKERTEKILGNEYVTILLNECSQISHSAYLIVLTRLAQRIFYERDGQQHQMRLKLFCDENPPLRGHWTHKMFIEKRDPATKRMLPNPQAYDYLLMNPADNQENLPASYLEALQNLPKRQRDRFWLGQFGAENENALWTEDIIERSKVDGHDLPQMVRIVIAVDPSGATDDPETTNDDIGIIVGGLGVDGCGYMLEDLTINVGPATWGKVVSSAFERHAADRVIAEINYGGAMVEHVIKTANPNIPVKTITASRSKMLRAEPISALHETGKLKLVGDYPELEDEMLNATTIGYTGDRSPNRLDAFVFAFSELFPGLVKEPKKNDTVYTIPNRRAATAGLNR